MENLLEIRTTLLAIVTFVLGVIPALVTVLGDIGTFLTAVATVLGSGDPWVILAGLWSLKAPLLALVASIGLLWARDWTPGGDPLGK